MSAKSSIFDPRRAGRRSSTPARWGPTSGRLGRGGPTRWRASGSRPSKLRWRPSKRRQNDGRDQLPAERNHRHNGVRKPSTSDPSLLEPYGKGNNQGPEPWRKWPTTGRPTRESDGGPRPIGLPSHHGRRTNDRPRPVMGS